MAIARHEVTGLLLAGGQGRRMGGLDKGLQTLHGRSLAARALQRLSPQVAAVIVSANRHLPVYRALGADVHPDAHADTFLGPLAGFLSGLQHGTRPYLLTVPCDVPNFPLDLAARLGHALDSAPDADIAMAATPGAPPQRQPTFCLMRSTSRGLRESLVQFLQSGGRKIGQWTSQHRCAQVVFDDDTAFANINTLQDLAELQSNRE